MNPVTITAGILLGAGDATVNVFSHTVNYSHYFSAVSPGPWVLALAPGNYLVGIVGTCPPGGSVTINIAGIVSSVPAMPLPPFKTAGKFIQGVSITV
ncbi:hypothetical protein KXD93_25915 [Mucilaginibacter sp. BJC16-A38]|uniref:hypothetical protein n=1 Tax=Mucilaginibacter phenanthrenivorans TaxID=1234842 RepID=UPI00215743DB|nr:hypothetical protein [Mucilaginibacter phenanthrenivorans]MCR8561121.1 hypothetical protein [Mucilaginibacter phenanthrenivorans]